MRRAIPTRGLFKKFVVSLMLPMAALWPSIAVSAVIYEHMNAPGLYGTLDQHLACGLPDPQFGCGPSAAVNGFVFLERTRTGPYSLIYDNNSGNFQADLEDTSVALGIYMGTQANGTRVPPFVKGLDAFMGDRLDSIANHFLAGQWGATWNAAVDGVRPYYLSDRTIPTWQFILGHLMRGAAVQIAMDGRDASGSYTVGHYVTVTGFYFADFDFDELIDQGTDIAFLRYVDSYSGLMGQADIWSSPSGILRIGYSGAAHQHGGVPQGTFTLVEGRIVGVVAAWIPEPSTWMLIMVGILAAPVARRVGPRGCLRAPGDGIAAA